jgi:hypothetical protein
MSDTTNGYYANLATRFGSRTEDEFVHGNDKVREATGKLPTIMGWYHILRAHYQFPVFEAIRFALWLGR